MDIGKIGATFVLLLVAVATGCAAGCGICDIFQPAKNVWGLDDPTQNKVTAILFDCCGIASLFVARWLFKKTIFSNNAEDNQKK
jgi:hypothetical protein